MITILVLIALICAIVALELRSRQKRHNYIERKEIDQIRAFRSKWQ